MNLIDATLSMIDAAQPLKEQADLFMELAMDVGVTQFQVSPYIYKILDGGLPEGASFYMEICNIDEKVHYPNIDHFIMKKKVGKDFITMIQLNDLKEVMHLRNYNEAAEVMLVGMDDFLCFDYKYVFDEITKIFDASKLYFCPENSFHMATATGLMIECIHKISLIATFTGLGNRAATEQLIVSLRIFKHFKVNQKLESLARLKKLLEEMTGNAIPDKMPIFGGRIFWVESGIHVDGIIKNPANYELYPPELVGQKRTIVIGKHSGMSSVRVKMKELGYHEESEEKQYKILMKSRNESVEKCRNLSDEEFMQIVGMFL